MYLLFPQYNFFIPDLRSFFLKDNSGTVEVEGGTVTVQGEVYIHTRASTCISSILVSFRGGAHI